MNVRSNRSLRRNAFTLLELFLTLSLAVVLMTLVNSAFRFYASDMDSNDADMRRTMLASSLMQMIEDDLRASLHPEPFDASALEELLSSTAAASMGGGNNGGGGGGGSSSGGDSAGVDAADEEMVMEDTALDSGAVVLQTPGLIGDQYQIQIDASRIPRLEEYAMLMDADPANLQDLPSDLKTITYYVQPADVSGVDDPLAQLDATTSSSGGLVRRVLDRSAHSYATLMGNVGALNQTGELLAPEVASITFSYWDGLTWQIEWNSDTLGELPLAVKIEMAMIDPMIDVNAQEPRMFTHIIRLPMAKMIEEEDEELSEVAGT